MDDQIIYNKHDDGWVSMGAFMLMSRWLTGRICGYLV
jgi:hypothetical protein